MQPKTRAMLVLTAGLIFVFGYSGAGKLVSPNLWATAVPYWMDGWLGLGQGGWLIVIGITELFLAFLLLIPVRTVRLIGAILMCIHFIAVLTQISWEDGAVHIVGLLAATLALLCLI